MWQIAEGLVVSAKVVEDRLAGIDVSGSAYAMSQVGERNLLAVEIICGIREHRESGRKSQYGMGGTYFAATTAEAFSFSTAATVCCHSLGSFLPTKGRSRLR